MSKPGPEYLDGQARRNLDILVSSTALAVGSVPATVIAGVLAVEHGPSNILFNQPRVHGFDSDFSITKFRTIPPGENCDYYTVEDPRASAFDNVLRRTGVDEYPQFLNVLGGSMTLFGVRSLLQRDIDFRYSADPKMFEDWFYIYQNTKPAITGHSGIWYHKALGDGLPSTEIFKAAMLMDIDYHEHASLAKDLRLLKMAGAMIGSLGIRMALRALKPQANN